MYHEKDKIFHLIMTACCEQEIKYFTIVPLSTEGKYLGGKQNKTKTLHLLLELKGLAISEKFTDEMMSEISFKIIWQMEKNLKKSGYMYMYK